MEPRFGFDFSHIRVHTDRMAADSARMMGARAFAVGSHVVFARGEYEPGKAVGRKLLAHELAHTIQQGGTSQPHVAMSPDERSPAETVAWFDKFYVERMGFSRQDLGGGVVKLTSPDGTVTVSINHKVPQMRLFIDLKDESYSKAEYDFAANRFVTVDEHIKMEEYEVELTFGQRLAHAASAAVKTVGGLAICAGGTAISVGTGAVAACAYGADVSASGVSEMFGGEGRTLTNKAVTAAVSQVTDEETAQNLTDQAELAFNVIYGAYTTSAIVNRPPSAVLVPGEPLQSRPVRGFAREPEPRPLGSPAPSRPVAVFGRPLEPAPTGAPAPSRPVAGFGRPFEPEPIGPPAPSRPVTKVPTARIPKGSAGETGTASERAATRMSGKQPPTGAGKKPQVGKVEPVKVAEAGGKSTAEAARDLPKPPSKGSGPRGPRLLTKPHVDAAIRRLREGRSITVASVEQMRQIQSELGQLGLRPQSSSGIIPLRTEGVGVGTGISGRGEFRVDMAHEGATSGHAAYPHINITLLDGTTVEVTVTGKLSDLQPTR
jgi:predicted phage tail protein